MCKESIEFPENCYTCNSLVCFIRVVNSRFTFILMLLALVLFKRKAKNSNQEIQTLNEGIYAQVTLLEQRKKKGNEKQIRKGRKKERVAEKTYTP